LIAQLGFTNAKRFKQCAKDLYHGNLSQLEILWKWISKHFGCWKNSSKTCKWIHIKQLKHGSTCIWFHGQLEHKLLNVKGSYCQHFRDLYIAIAQFIGVSEGNLNITFKCLLKLFSTSYYSQYYSYMIAKLCMMPWARNLIYNSSTSHLAIATTHIQFVDSTQLKKKWKKEKSHEVKHEVG